MQNDTISDAMRAVRLTGALFFRVQLRPPYSVTAMDGDQLLEQHAPHAREMLPFHLVTRGPIWFEVAGAEPMVLNDGDIIVMPHGASHSLMDRPGSPPIPVGELQHAFSGPLPTLQWGGDGPESEALCGFFHTSSQLFNPLIDALPSVLVIPHDPDAESSVASMLRRSFEDTFAKRPGAAALMERLTELLFLEIAQRHLADGRSSGLIGGLSDPLVADALRLIHAETSRHWTLDTLSEAVGASRSMLSERFRSRVGLSPIRYLSAWRMELAAQRLSETEDAIAEIAAGVGYESEAAFNRAFKRHAGDPPGTWRRQRHAALPV